MLRCHAKWRLPLWVWGCGMTLPPLWVGDCGLTLLGGPDIRPQAAIKLYGMAGGGGGVWGWTQRSAKIGLRIARRVPPLQMSQQEQ